MNRVTSIDARMLERFEQGYAARPELNVMSNAVSRTALPDAAFVPAAAAKLRMDFSVLVKTNNTFVLAVSGPYGQQGQIPVFPGCCDGEFPLCGCIEG